MTIEEFNTLRNYYKKHSHKMNLKIDQKITVWQSFKFADDVDPEYLKKTLEENNFEVLIDESKGFEEVEFLFDTVEEITVEDNMGNATLELWDGDKLLWKNK